MKFIVEVPDNCKWMLDKYQTMFELNNLDMVLSKILDPQDYGLSRTEYVTNCDMLKILVKTLLPIVSQMAGVVPIVETEVEPCAPLSSPQ